MSATFCPRGQEARTAGQVSAQEVGDRAGLSRVSARRYLEHLVTIGKAEVQPRYGMANRPAHGYRLT